MPIVSSKRKYFAPSIFTRNAATFFDSATTAKKSPLNQSFSSVTFILEDASRAFGAQIVKIHTLRINPDNLVLDTPPRTTVYQTLGGEYVEDHGLGIQTLELSGSTGWVVRTQGGEEQDGFDRFKALYEQIYLQYYKLREEANQSGKDPAAITVSVNVHYGNSTRTRVFASERVGYAYQIVFNSFSLRRNKQHPLLFSYGITMTVLSEQVIDAARAGEEIESGFAAPKKGNAALLKRKLTSISAAADSFKLKNVLLEKQKPRLAKYTKFLTDIAKITNGFVDAVKDGTEYAQSQLGIVGTRIRAVANSLGRLGNVEFLVSSFTSTLKTSTVGELNRIIRSYNEISCNLQAFSPESFIPDIELVKGESGCGASFGAEPSAGNLNQGNTFGVIFGDGNSDLVNIVSLDIDSRDKTIETNLTDFALEAPADYGYDPQEYMDGIMRGLFLGKASDFQAELAKTDATGNSYSKVSSTQVVSLTADDSLPFLATRYLGNVDRWQEIAVLNNLRYPFISDDPVDQFGPKIRDIVLTGAITATDTVIDVTSTDEILVGMRLYFQEFEVVEEKIIESVDEVAVQVTVTEQFANAFTTGAQGALYNDPNNLIGGVLQNGEGIQIPAAGDGINNSSVYDSQTTAQSLESVLGTDIELDSNGFIALGDYDVDTLSGVPNMVQALQLKLDTDTGELAHHPTYGNSAVPFLGRQNTDALQPTIINRFKQGMLQDTRVSDVKVLDYTRKDDYVLLDATVVLGNSKNEQEISLLAQGV